MPIQSSSFITVTKYKEKISGPELKQTNKTWTHNIGNKSFAEVEVWWSQFQKVWVTNPQTNKSTYWGGQEHQPIGTEIFSEDIFLLVDTLGLVCKYAGQAFKNISQV